MDLTKFNFPHIEARDIVFSVMKTDQTLLEEAKKQGFYDGHTPYNDLFNQIFFKGGHLNFKKDLDPAFKEKAMLYMRSLMNSFEPKHEDKEAICALLLSNLVEVN